MFQMWWWITSYSNKRLGNEIPTNSHQTFTKIRPWGLPDQPDKPSRRIIKLFVSFWTGQGPNRTNGLCIGKVMILTIHDRPLWFSFSSGIELISMQPTLIVLYHTVTQVLQRPNYNKWQDKKNNIQNWHFHIISIKDEPYRTITSSYIKFHLHQQP